MADRLRVLEERVSALDALRPYHELLHEDVDPDLSHFIRTIASITPQDDSEPGLPSVSASAADEIMGACRLVDRFRYRSPEIALGPLVGSEQYWVATGRPAHLAPRVDALDEANFVQAAATDDIPVSTKPFNLGLYTSTAVFGTFGMWWCYLLLNRGSTIFPPPWRVWSVQADANAEVLEITTAVEWVDFVLADPLCSGGFIYPNWKLVADRWDGIHMTISAVAATQGVSFMVDRHAVAPPYWGVESTLWLRWAFAAVESLHEGVNGPTG